MLPRARQAGTTYGGGAYGNGSAFEVSTSGKERVLHSFAYSYADGAHPWGTFVELNGSIYATASLGGKRSIGTIFRIYL